MALLRTLATQVAENTKLLQKVVLDTEANSKALEGMGVQVDSTSVMLKKLERSLRQ
jgi:hypothetical protein